ncbi:uncharacterized protein ARMOST_08106 [Armillaria ostoyae]|uniref:Uncharacterized protein n=1 Tax=Armillaria ostoyae TaxID=47428 RepID=A0A284R7P1_ARMOS|nr:uncharacterized protein ARMOST_08106 [Armillaria ostoyae]
MPKGDKLGQTPSQKLYCAVYFYDCGFTARGRTPCCHDGSVIEQDDSERSLKLEVLRNCIVHCLFLNKYIKPEYDRFSRTLLPLNE